MDVSRLAPRRLFAFGAMAALATLALTIAPRFVQHIPLASHIETGTAALSLTTAYGNLPLWFVPNAGQSDSAVQFQANGMGGSLFFAKDEVVLAVPTAEALFGSHNRPDTVVRLRFDGANLAPQVVGDQPQAGSVNYLFGDEPSNWHTNLPTYGGVVYQQLYDGIDLRYDGNEGLLKGTYTVAPGADPSRISWRYLGAAGMSVNAASGDLVIALPDTTATLTEKAPIAWQEINGSRVPVDVRYTLQTGPLAETSVGFELGAYNPSQPLIIDPYLVYSTLVGGGQGDEGRAIAVDADGNTYVTGTTLSTDFPTVGPFQGSYGGPSTGNIGDAFVIKLNPAGNELLYATYLGGTQSDVADAIAVDADGNVYLTGGTTSPNFPLQTPLQASLGPQQCSSPPCADAFVSKLNPAGNGLVFSTYLGGNGNDNGIGNLTNFGTRSHKLGIAVDGAGDVYVSGSTDSTDFPTLNPAQSNRAGLSDLFVTKLKADGSSLLYSSYLGGTGADYSGGIGIDGAGNIYVAGGTISSNFPTKNALQANNGGENDVVLAKLNPAASGDASLVYSTYLGGSSSEQAFGIAVSGAGTVALTGWVTSPNFPIQGGFQTANGGGARDAFVALINAAGNAVLYSSYLGGSGYDVGYGVALDIFGRIYVVGETNSANFPVKEPWQATGTNSIDLFVTRIDPTAGDTLSYSSYLGGLDSENGYAIAIDGNANVYVTGSVGGGNAATFPIYTTIGSNTTTDGVLIAKLGPESTKRVYLPAVRTP